MGIVTATSTDMPDRTAEILSRIRSAVYNSVATACEIVAEEAKAIVPVRTGTLRDSISARPPAEENGVVVGAVEATAPYAMYVEYGTGRRGAESPGRGEGPYSMGWAGMAAQPYLRPAIDSSKSEIQQTFVENLRNAILGS